MARLVGFVLLLLLGWGLLYMLFDAQEKQTRTFPVSGGRRIEKPLPTPWQGAAKVQVRLPQSDTSGSEVTGFFPGSEIEVQVEGFPAERPARVGIGLSGLGYREAGEAVSDRNGSLQFRLTIPGDASPGDTVFVMVTSQGVPSVQAVSEIFVISAP